MMWVWIVAIALGGGASLAVGQELQWGVRWSLPLQGTWELSEDGAPWVPVTVPHASARADELRYRRNIRVDSAALARFRWHLYTLGIADVAEVWLNGEYVGQFGSYGLPAWFPLPQGKLRPGVNALELRIQRVWEVRAFLGSVYPVGCLREVYLVGTAPQWIQGVAARVQVAPSVERAELALSVSLGADAAQAEASTLGLRVRLLRLPDSANVVEEVRPIAAGTQVERFRLSITAPQMWSPAQRHRYALRTELLRDGTVIDAVVQPVGFRHVDTWADTAGTVWLRLNGVARQLYGVEYYVDAAAIGAPSATQVRQMLSAGIRLIRFRGALPHPQWLELCAREGILAVLELPIAELPPSLLQRERYRYTVEQVTRLVLDAYGANPAVVAVGTFQGIPVAGVVHNPVLQRLGQLIRQAGMLTAWEFYGGGHYPDTAAAELVLVRVHEPFVEWERLVQELRRWRQAVPRAVVLPIWGFPVWQQQRGYLVPGSEEATAYWLWRFLKTAQQLTPAGAVVWSWNDYVPAYPLVSFPEAERFSSRSGLLASSGEPRAAYHVVQAAVRGEPEPLLSPGQEQRLSLPLYTLLGIGLLLVFGVVLNRSPQVQQGIWRALIHPHGLFVDLREGYLPVYRVTGTVLGMVALVVGAFAAVWGEWMVRQPEWVMLLWRMVPWEPVQWLLAWVCDRPLVAVVGTAAALALGSVGGAVLLWGVARLLRTRVSWKACWLLTVWAAVPLLLPVPLLLLGEQLVRLSWLRWVNAALLLLGIAWSGYRWLYGVGVLLQRPTWKVLLTLAWIGALLGGIVLGIYELGRELLSTMQYALAWWIP
jgi:hypothetical protein